MTCALPLVKVLKMLQGIFFAVYARSGKMFDLRKYDAPEP